MLDVESQFPRLLDRVEALVKGVFPIKSRQHLITASNWRWDNLGNSVRDDLVRHRQAKLREESITAKLLADVRISEITSGKVVDQVSGYILLRVPHITARSSYIVNGKELQTINQLRLRPGLYTRLTADNNVETFVNTSASGTYRVILDRETGKFIFRVGTSAHFPLPVILRVLGVSDSEMHNAWGADIYKSSVEKVEQGHQVMKLIAKLRPNLKVSTPEEASKLIATFFESKPFDPKVNSITLGTPFAAISGPALLASSKKCLEVSRGKSPTDDTESLAFKSLHSVEDFVPERLERVLPSAVFEIKQKVDRTPKVSTAIPADIFTKSVQSFFTTSEFARHVDQSNPVDMIGANFLTTTMGEGGIGSEHAVTDAVRLVHPSHAGVLDGIQTPEGQKIGITGHLTVAAKKVGNDIHIPVIDAKTGQKKSMNVKDLDTKVIAFPDQYDLTKTPPKALFSTVKARKQSDLKTFPAKSVEYIYSSPQSFFSSTSNMVPFLHNDDGNRVGMADRHIEQTIGLKNPDVPLVQARYGLKGYEEVIGSGVNPKSPVNGTVRKITDEGIYISDGRKAHRVPLHNMYPLNSDGFMHDTPTVAVGDKVTAGQAVANNNFTKNDSLALGKNLRTAFIPYKGYNFEDGIVISQSAAEKLTSIHKYEHKLEKGSDTKVGLKLLLAHFPDQQKTVSDKKKYDTDGVIKPGATINYGELLIPAVRKQVFHADYDYKKLHNALSNQWIDVSIYWDNAHPAQVVDVVKTHQFVKIITKSEEPAQIGDKLSGRHGGKGIITLIIPDGEMYRDGNGETIDLLFNPTGTVGRVNPGQLYEAAAGKAARVSGKTHYVKNFEAGSTLDKVKKTLSAAGLDPHGEEKITDPTTGRVIPNVLVGDMHFLKLRHRVAKKFSARGYGGEYTINEQPAKTDEGSAQRIGGLDLYALLSGGATNFVNDAFMIKGQKNDAYWRAIQLGLPAPAPAAPYVSEKFTTFLRGAGIDLTRKGDLIQASPMTDAKVLSLSRGEIKEPSVVTATDLKPEKDGLFDPAVTGGIGGEHYAHIALPEAIVHPLMWRAVASVSEMSEKDLKQVSEGALGIKDGKLVSSKEPGAVTGGDGIRKMLANINVDSELRKIDIQYKTTKSVMKKDHLARRRRFLESLKHLSLSPADAYTIKNVSVIPPKFRAIYPLPDGALNVSDANHGYREILMVSNALKNLKNIKVDDAILGGLRRDLNNSVGGLVGTQEPITRSSYFKGFMATIKGASNKHGLFQGRVMSRPQDLSARSTIIPDPKFGIDEVGIPEKMALTLYKPFVVRRLVGLGYPPLEAREMTETGAEMAMKALHVEIKDRPLVLNRAPSLHKFSMLGLKPTLVSGEAIKINPLIVSGLNADFDGDTMGVHVPVTEAARKEVIEKMMPSRNLFSPASGRVVNQPTMETVLGLYLMSNPVGTPIAVASEKEAMAKYESKAIEVNAALKIGNRATCVGQILLNRVIPSYAQIDGPMTKKVMSSTIETVAKKDPSFAAEMMNKLKDLGNHYVTEVGFSVSLRDLHIDTKKRDKILSDADRRTKVVGFSKASEEAAKRISDLVHSDKDNRFVVISTGSGALGGKAGSVNRLLATPVAVTDHRGVPIPVQIKKSYAEGHDLGSYWATLPGARKGMMDKGLSTADTGYLTKRLVQANIDTIISETDCRTTRGVTLEPGSQDLVGRVVVNTPAQGSIANHIITPDIAKNLNKAVMVRSPLTCQSRRGICARCFGLNENGQFYPIGFHIGTLAAQTIGEPSTQLSLKAFHVGGAVGQGATNKGFNRVDQIFTLPDNVKGRAVLSAETGAISFVERSPLGGWNVFVNKAKHYIPNELGFSKRLGDKVKAGDQLSEGGSIRPQDVLQTTGDINKVRDVLISELDDNFRSSGVAIKRRIYETVVKPMTRFAKVTDSGSARDFHAGDVISVDRIEQHNSTALKGGMVQYEPMLVGVGKVPHLGEDFVGRMMHDRIIDTAREAVTLGRKTNIGSTGHPVSHLAFLGSKNNLQPILPPNKSK